jgi:hypothetical protein
MHRPSSDLFGEKFRDYGISRPDHGSQLAVTVPDIFLVARDEVKSSDLGGKSDIMMRASKVLEECIRREGSVEWDKLGEMPALVPPIPVVRLLDS